MKAKIEIRCESVGELLDHLAVIRDEIKRECRAQFGKDWNQGGAGAYNVDHVKKFYVEDANCYGEHTLTVNNLR
jgi:hypothetical protein